MRRYVPQMVATDRIGARRWLAARIGGLGEASLGLLLPVVVAGLMFGATCGAPDQVRRGQAQPTGGSIGGAGGNSSSVRGGTIATDGGSTTSPPPTGGSTSSGGASSSGGTSSTGGTSASGGTAATGGRTATGGASATGGRSATGGTVTGGTVTGGRSGTVTGGTVTGGTRTGGTTGTGGATSPFGGGGSGGGAVTGGRGGTVTGGTTGGTGGAATTGGSAGGTGGRSGTGGSTSTSTAPTSGLQVWVAQKTSGGTGQITLDLRIDNKTPSSVDLSTVTLRYWYKDEGLGTALVLATNYVSIGYSNQGTAAGKAVAATPPATGADHYLELSFTGTLAAQGDKVSNDQFNIRVTMHTANYQGAVDVTNDYSYDGGAAAVYEDKITLHDKSGKVIWGTAP